MSKRSIYWHQIIVGQLSTDFYIEFNGNHRNFKYDSIVFSQHHSGCYMEKKIEVRRVWKDGNLKVLQSSSRNGFSKRDRGLYVFQTQVRARFKSK